MKRREMKFVPASARLSPEQIKAAPRLRKDQAQPTAEGAPEQRAGKVAARKRTQRS